MVQEARRVLPSLLPRQQGQAHLLPGDRGVVWRDHLCIRFLIPSFDSSSWLVRAASWAPLVTYFCTSLLYM